ncbi:hypothetical protein D3C86_1159170 [compost metagenome]
MMEQTPFSHNRSATGNDTGYTICGQVYVSQQHTSMNGKIRYALLCLLYQGIPEDLPGQVFGYAFYFFQCLVDRHRTDRHRAVADNPLTGFMNIFTGRQVHNGIGTPTASPYCFFYFLFNTGSHCAITDIGIDLNQEVATNNHWFTFGMINIVRDNGTAGCNFIADKFRGYFVLRGIGTEAISGMLMIHTFGCSSQLFYTLVFADRNILHFGGDDAFLCIMQLGYNLSCFSFYGLVLVGKSQFLQLRISPAFATVCRAHLRQKVYIITILYPLLADTR